MRKSIRSWNTEQSYRKEGVLDYESSSNNRVPRFPSEKKLSVLSTINSFLFFFLFTLLIPLSYKYVSNITSYAKVSESF